MDSVCEEAGPLSTSCHSEIMCSTSANLQKEIAACLTKTEVQNQVADITPSSSEMVREDAKPFQDDRTAPKPGKASKSNKQHKNC